MSRTVAFISMSLDGFGAGPDISVQHPLGRKGEALHEWLFADRPADSPDSQVIASVFDHTGAVIIGNRMFTVGWDVWDKQNPFAQPTWVVTHNPSETISPESSNPIYFTSELQTALASARTSAGERDVLIGGGPTLIQNVLAAGNLDEIIVTVVPIFLGSGTRLFGEGNESLSRLEPIRTVQSPRVTHLHYRINAQ